MEQPEQPKCEGKNVNNNELVNASNIGTGSHFEMYLEKWDNELLVCSMYASNIGRLYTGHYPMSV